MIVECVRVTGDSPELGPGYGLEYTDRTNFSIILKKKYYVHGLSIFNNGITVLLNSSNNMSLWFPLQLFQVIDSYIPPTWKISTRNAEETGIRLVLGYHELTQNPDHLNDLVERVSSAEAIFQEQVATHPDPE